LISQFKKIQAGIECHPRTRVSNVYPGNECWNGYPGTHSDH